ncbi:hypothetical protein GCM10023087_04960 [Microbacterium rhizosphaerae]
MWVTEAEGAIPSVSQQFGRLAKGNLVSVPAWPTAPPQSASATPRWHPAMLHARRSQATSLRGGLPIPARSPRGQVCESLQDARHAESAMEREMRQPYPGAP